jgi:hypothetical protein
MAFKGTKEWHAVEYAGFFRINNEPYYEGVDIFSLEDLPEEEVKANVKLAEAAPDMLNALQVIKTILESPKLIDAGDLRRITNSAIDKATK